MAWLALDFGLKRTGVALSTSGDLVTPVGTWLTQPWTTFISTLKSFCAEQEVTTVVVGQATLTDPTGVLWTDRLAAELSLPVFVVKEDHTTAEARQQTGRHDHADTTAACLILERYLEEQPPS